MLQTKCTATLESKHTWSGQQIIDWEWYVTSCSDFSMYWLDDAMQVCVGDS